MPNLKESSIDFPVFQVIYQNGVEDEDDHTSAILFGDLFRMYTRISDKVVGILLRARKYGLVHFEPEILFQGQVISLHL